MSDDDQPVDALVAIVDDDTIVLRFSAPLAELKMSPREARLLGQQLRAAANTLELEEKGPRPS